MILLIFDFVLLEFLERCSSGNPSVWIDDFSITKKKRKKGRKMASRDTMEIVWNLGSGLGQVRQSLKFRCPVNIHLVVEK